MPSYKRRLTKAEEQAAIGTGSYAGFGEMLLGFNLYPKQRQILDALQPCGSYVAARCCNSAGKTSIVITTAILAHLALARGKVISTSGSFRQIKDQLNTSLRLHIQKFPGWRFLDCRLETDKPNCFWDGFSTNDSGKFEGHHGSEECPLLIIVDEAKTVKDEVYQAIERCRPPQQWCRVLVVSSPGYAGGEFYALNTSKVHTLTHPPIVIKAEECPHITPEEIAAVRKKWGNEHPLVRSMVDSEFMPFVEGAVVQLDALDSLLANPPPYRPGERKAFCDFAWSESASGDENVLALRDGNRITLEATFRAKGIHNVCAIFISNFTRLGLKPWEIEGDADGEGANIIKQLRQMGWPIGSALNGGPPRYNDHYGDLASEMWCEGNQKIINKQFILPMDSELYGQMLNRRIAPANKGKLKIESKIAMKDPNRTGGSVPCSPDRADGIFGAMAPMPVIRGTQVYGQESQAQSVQTKNDYWTEPAPAIAESYDLPGCHFG